MDLQHWIALAILVLPLVGFGLTILSHLSFIARSTAWTAIVAGAINIVAHIETDLKANPTASAAQLLSDGIAELRQVYAESFAKLGGTAVPDTVLQLLFQRISSRLPVNVDAAILQFLNGGGGPGGATTVSGALGGVVTIGRRTRFVRPVGVALARRAPLLQRLVLWAAWLLLLCMRLVAALFRPRPFVYTFEGEVLR